MTLAVAEVLNPNKPISKQKPIYFGRACDARLMLIDVRAGWISRGFINSAALPIVKLFRADLVLLG